MKKAPQYFLWSVLLLLIMTPYVGMSQIADATDLLETPISGKAIYYASVLVSDLDENGSIDALIGLSQGEIAGYSSFSCIIRWTSAQGVVDAHNGSGYAYNAANPVGFPDFITQPEGEKYEVWFDVDVVAGTWIPWVKGPGMAEPAMILESAEFRAKGVASLDRWTATHQNGGDDGLDVFTTGFVDNVGDRPASYDQAGISDVSLSPAGLNGSWDAEVLTYTATFPFGTTSVEVGATGNPRGSQITGVGTLDVSAGSGQLSLMATSEGGSETKTYTIDWTVNDPNKDATLSSLTIDVGDSVNFGGLAPAFGTTITEYSINVPFGTQEITVNATAGAAAQGATVTGAVTVDVSSGEGQASITVTSADQSATKTYTIDITVDQFNVTGVTVDATRFDGTVQSVYFGIFEKGQSYVKDLPAGTVAIGNMVVTTNDPGATIQIPTDLTLINGEVSGTISAVPQNLSEVVSYDLTFRVLPNAAPTQTGLFESALTGTHVVYAKISVPSQYTADGLFALSSDYMTEYPQFSAGFRFVNGLPVQLHNGGYTATAGNPNISYDTIYHCWMALDMANQSYSVYYKVEGETTQYTVGENAVFRNGADMQATRWGAYRNNNAAYKELNVMKVALVTNVGDIPAQGSDASLSSLTLSAGKLNETFSPTTFNYTASLPSGSAFVDVSATATDPAAFILGQGRVVLDSLGEGADTLTITSDDGAATQQYVVSFSTLDADKDASLNALSVEEGTLSPAFNPDVFSYSLSVPFATDSIHVSAIANSDSASVSGTGAISVGTGVTADVVVTSGDQSVTNTYSIVVTKEAASGNANLSHLGANKGTFNIAFEPDVTSYELTVDFGETSVDVRYLTTHPGATVTGGGMIDLTGKAEEVISLVVTAEDGTTQKSYAIKIIVGGPSDDSSLESITLSAGSLSPAFDSATFSYTVDVLYGTPSITITGIKNHPGASVAGDGVIDLSSGSGTANILVTAENNSTSTYTVTITVLPGSDDATLSSISVTNATLDPAFDPEVFEYIAVVPLGTATANITAIKSDANATVTGAGALDVISGSGVANIKVVSETGDVTNTYKVSVYVGSAPKVLSNDLETSVKVYPNPVTDNLNIDLGGTVDRAVLKVFDINGKQMAARTLIGQKMTLDVSVYPSGLYLIRIESKQATLNLKFVK